MTQGTLHLRDEHVLGSGDAEDIGVEDTQNVDPAGLEFGAQVGEV